MWHVLTQIMESRNHSDMVQVLPVVGCCVGPQLPLPVTSVALAIDILRGSNWPTEHVNRSPCLACPAERTER